MFGKIITDRSWSYRLFRIALILLFAWWFLGMPDLLVRYGWAEEWPNTDFTRHSVPLDEIVSGGPGKDGIPAIDEPRFLDAGSKIDWLDESEPVIALIIGNKARAYPIQVLIWHEIVNDVLNDIPVAVTFCPLCNASIVFDRRAGGRLLDFGTTGRLRLSDLVMYDRQTESWWQQFIGEGIVGEYTGTVLKKIPSRIMSWGDFRKHWPDGQVLSRNTGYLRSYGVNPYSGYDDINNTPFLLDREADPRLPPMERIAVVEVDNSIRAYPYRVLREKQLLQDTLGGRPVVLFTSRNTRSALDKREIRHSRLILSVQAFHPGIDDRSLNFILRDGKVFDEQTGSEWSLAGRAVSGPLRGRTLRPVSTETHFAFAWLVFRPETDIYKEAVRPIRP